MTYDYKAEKRAECLAQAVMLYRQGSDFDYGALVQYDTTLEDRYVAAIEELSLPLDLETKVGGFGFEYGNASFLDISISRLESESSRSVCLFALFCSYVPLYVLGESEQLGSGSFVLPGFSGVDRFTTTWTREVAGTVASHMKSHDLHRAYVDELSEDFLSKFELQSVLVERDPKVFDAYFNWND